MEIPDHDPFAEPTYADEPGEGAPAVRTVTLVGPLAQRDPRAAADETGEIAISGATSFDDLLLRARRRGFLFGVAAGAVLASAAAAVVAVALAPATPSPPTVATLAAAPVAEPAPVAVPAPAVAARRPASTAAQRAPAPDASAAPVNAAGLDLRGADEQDGLPEDEGAAETEEAGATTPVERVADAARGAAPARSLEPREVAGALAARRDAIDACVAATDPDGSFGGGRRFLLVLSVHPSGRVADARIDDPAVEGTALGRCLASVAQDMSFGPFDGEPVEVELPLRLAAPE